MGKAKIGLFAAAIPFALSLSGSAPAEMLHLKVGSFDPLLQPLQVPDNLQARPARGATYQIVQFKGGIQRSDQESLAQMGLAPVAYLPENAYVLLIDERQRAQLAANPRTEWIGAFHPYYKIDQTIGHKTFLTEERRRETSVGVYRLDVTLHDGAAPEAAVREARRLGFDILDVFHSGPRWDIQLAGRLNRINELAHEPSIAFIQETAENTLRNDRTSWVVQTDVTGLTKVWNHGFRGENMIVGILDTRINMNHDMFRDPVNNTVGPNHRKVIGYYTSLGSESHGTHVAGTIAGDQFPITGSTFRNGMAYRARITYGQWPSTSGSLYNPFVQHYNAGARIHTNSWGNDGTTQYTMHCQHIDQYSWDYEDAVVGFAVTNTSTLKTPENAKNVLAVGNTNHTPNHNSPNSGGAGPTNDGRRKPEIWAPGTGIMSASSSSSNGFTSMTGTSMACPAVMGAAALIRQYYLSSGYPFRILSTFARGTTARSHNPSGALIRATIMNGGVDMSGMVGYPGAREGWGRLVMDRVLSFPGDDRKLLIDEKRNAQGLLPGQTETVNFYVTSPAEQLKITMTFTDWPAAINASFAPVNNMDLEVQSPSGTIYRGNNINTSVGLSNVGGSHDNINNTEMVILNAPEVGIWTVRIKATAVNMGTRQGYALVVTGAVSN
jgi:hypothetical protein